MVSLFLIEKPYAHTAIAAISTTAPAMMPMRAPAERPPLPVFGCFGAAGRCCAVLRSASVRGACSRGAREASNLPFFLMGIPSYSNAGIPAEKFSAFVLSYKC